MTHLIITRRQHWFVLRHSKLLQPAHDSNHDILQGVLKGSLDRAFVQNTSNQHTCTCHTDANLHVTIGTLIRGRQMAYPAGKGGRQVPGQLDAAVAASQKDAQPP